MIELVIIGTLESSGPLQGTTYEPVATTTVEAEKVPAGQTLTIMDDVGQVVLVIPEGDYWVKLNPEDPPIHMMAADFEAQYKLP